jgi:hypothetical protein
MPDCPKSTPKSTAFGLVIVNKRFSIFPGYFDYRHIRRIKLVEIGGSSQVLIFN